jgi:hypothetical protein
MFEFLAGWAAFAVVSVFILFVLWLVLKVFAALENKQISSAFFAAVLLGGPFVALGYAWYLLVAFVIETGFDALKFLVVLMVGGLFVALWACLEFVLLWIWASAFHK